METVNFKESLNYGIKFLNSVGFGQIKKIDFLGNFSKIEMEFANAVTYGDLENLTYIARCEMNSVEAKLYDMCSTEGSPTLVIDYVIYKGIKAIIETYIYDSITLYFVIINENSIL